MDIFELEKEQKILELRIISKKERIELERSRLDSKAIDYSKPTVQSSPHKDPMLDIFAKISEMEEDIEYCKDKLEQNRKEVDRLYQIFKEYKERDKQIYIEYYLKKYSTVQIGIRHGITDRQVRKILNKIENNPHIKKKRDIV